MSRMLGYDEFSQSKFLLW